MSLRPVSALRGPFVMVLAATLACNGDEVSGPLVGGLQIQIVTTGGDVDGDGYVLVIDGGVGIVLPANATHLFDDLAPGLHVLELDGIAPNCTVSPRDIRSVTVRAGDTTTVTFQVSCFITGVIITTRTDGLDPGPGYPLVVDGQPSPLALPVNGSLEVTRLSAGAHSVGLGQLPPNCRQTDAAPRVVTLSAGQLTPVGFDLVCTAAFGVLRVTASTSGDEPDPSGYVVMVDQAIRASVAVNGVGTITNLPGGVYTVALGSVSGNCTVAAPLQQAIEIKVGGLVRDTAAVSFMVSCRRLWELAFTRGSYIAVAGLDGSTLTVLQQGADPAWSPNGQRIAYSCGGICTMWADGSDVKKMPAADNEYSETPSWNPDGTLLAYTSYTCQYLDYYNYDCTTPQLTVSELSGIGRIGLPVPPDIDWVSAAAWSPDGATIAYSCRASGTRGGICTSRVDGRAARHLTPLDLFDTQPAWSPDGRKIAFSTSRFGTLEIAIMNADGSGVVRTGVAGTSPSWSPDGRRILFARIPCGAGSCAEAGLALMNPDGTDVTFVTSNAYDGTPAWRP